MNLQARLISTALLSCLASSGLGQGLLTQLIDNGPTAQRINVVVLSEGYLSSQTNQFQEDAAEFVDYFLTTPPFDPYRGFFNAFTIFVPSPEAGSDHPSTGVYRNTYFNSSYDSYGITRLVTIPPNNFDASYANGKGKVDALLQNLLPEYDVVALIVNDPAYGGSGGNPLLVSVNSAAPEIGIHEFAHNYAGLGDEYTSPYPGYPDIEEPNTTRETNRTRIKWRDWILDTTPIPTPPLSAYNAVIGLFEGAHYQATGWYRPKLDCKMNHLNVPFCDVCAEALIKSTYGLVRPIDSHSPPADIPIMLQYTQMVTLTVLPLQTTDHSLQLQWATNDVPVPGATNASFEAWAPAFPKGANRVTVQITDPTPLVRTDPNQLLVDSKTWSLFVRSASRPTLEIEPHENDLLLSWAVGESAFLVETAPSIEGPWELLPDPASQVGDRYQIILALLQDSQFFRLRQFQPLFIAQQPQPLTVELGSSATFNVAAFGEEPIQYQWRHDGQDLPQATNSTLLLNQVDYLHAGSYSVLVSDALGSTVSAAAALTLWVEPTILEHPQSLTVNVGQTATFRVTVTNAAALPIGYLWRKGFGIIERQVLPNHTSAYTITNVQPGDAGTYRVTVTNAVSSVPGLLSDAATLTVLE